MYWNKFDQFFLKKIYQNVISRKSKFLKHNLCINNKSTKIKIIKITNKNLLKETLSGLNYLEDNVCFLITYTNNLNTNDFHSNFDIVGFDYSWKANVVLPNIKPNTKILLKKNNKGCWFLKPGTIDFYQIKNGDFISDRD